MRDLLETFNAPQVLLLILMMLALWMAFRSQHRPDVDWIQLFKNDEGKMSASAFMILTCGVLMSWVLLYLTMFVVKSDGDSMDKLLWFFISYGIIFSGTKVAEKMADLLAAIINARYGKKE